MVGINSAVVAINVVPDVSDGPYHPKSLQLRNPIVPLMRLQSAACKCNWPECTIILLLRGDGT